jgi:deoxyribodipyrimidine photo-lyase
MKELAFRKILKTEGKIPGVFSAVPSERIRLLNNAVSRKGRYVLYWMHAAHRTVDNPALQYAIERSNHLHVPCVAYFGLWNEYPEANLRHFWFMLEGFAEVASELESIGIRCILQIEPPDEGVVSRAAEAALVVTDRGYLKVHRQWYRNIADRCRCPVVQIEGNTIVPVEAASQKEEYSAATFRPRIWRQAERFLQLPVPVYPDLSSVSWEIPTLAGDSPDHIVSMLEVDRSVHPSPYLKGGSSKAKQQFERFLKRDLDRYADSRKNPGNPTTSQMSPYLHFGQVSPVSLALEVIEHGGPGYEAFMEELMVRRELSINLVHYNPYYDTFSCLPRWSQQTLMRHASDPRPYLYTLEELEHSHTHDAYWNAAQAEMVSTGRMQGYMRMYWGKKILEWSPTPQDAYQRALYLNNKYEIDGRDPNGYAGIAWCFGKHDRPWKERPVFGTVRYMGAEGLHRKFDMEPYVQRYISR